MSITYPALIAHECKLVLRKFNTLAQGEKGKSQPYARDLLSFNDDRREILRYDNCFRYEWGIDWCPWSPHNTFYSTPQEQQVLDRQTLVDSDQSPDNKDARFLSSIRSSHCKNHFKKNECFTSLLFNIKSKKYFNSLFLRFEKET